MTIRTATHLQILDIIRRQGPIGSRQIQGITGLSQPTVSRYLTDLLADVTVFGAARSTAYAIQKSIHGRPGSQPIFNINNHGALSHVGQLDFLAGDKVRAQIGNHVEIAHEDLPWFLSTFRLEGFLGRLQAAQIGQEDWDTNPERWSIDQVLSGALSLYDIPGSLILGERSKETDGLELPPLSAPSLPDELNRLAHLFVDSLPAGSSAGGEQPKFLAKQENQRVIVKFSAPKDHPYGQRWSDLLHCEAIASQVLIDFGYPAAVNHVVEAQERTFLISERFDRTAHGIGRRHVVSCGAAHRGLLKESYQHWGATAHRLAQIKALDKKDANTAQLFLEFGRLIGNTDMHSGNLAFFVDIDRLNRGGLSLAPSYDMLPMRWRPNMQQSDLSPYTPFHLDERALGTEAGPLALEFWRRISEHARLSKPLRETAKIMMKNIASARKFF